MIIENQRVVSIRYIMRNHKGEELENNIGDAPISYLHGSGNILPALESGLTGLQPGDKKSLSISGDLVAGLPEEYHFEIIIDDVRKATNEELSKGRAIQPVPDEPGFEDDQPV
jgi:FKBP-type peptidyl-prolyl cis-trans isomerase SlyD